MNLEINSYHQHSSAMFKVVFGKYLKINLSLLSLSIIIAKETDNTSGYYFFSVGGELSNLAYRKLITRKSS